jgi:hypothetical protein
LSSAARRARPRLTALRALCRRDHSIGSVTAAADSCVAS